MNCCTKTVDSNLSFRLHAQNAKGSSSSKDIIPVFFMSCEQKGKHQDARTAPRATLTRGGEAKHDAWLLHAA